MKGNAGMRVGGGIRSNKNVQVPVRRGVPAKGVSPAGVSQFGEALGNHATNKGTPTGYKGERFQTATPAGGGAPLGNAVATNVGKGGPGAGRTVQRSGTQGVHGPVNPGLPNPGANKPIFPGFK